MSPAIRERKNQMHWVVLLNVLTDISFIVMGFYLARVFRFESGLLPNANPAADYQGILIVSVPIWLAIFTFVGLYDRSHMKSASEEIKRIFNGVNTGIVAMIMLSFFLAERDVSRGFIAASWISCLLTVSAGRLVFRKVLHMIRSTGRLCVPMLVVGLNEEARAIARTLKRNQGIGFKPVGFVAANGELNGTSITRIEGLPVYGSAPDIAGAVDMARASAVLVASSAVPEDKLARLYRDLQDHDVEVRVSAGLTHIAASRVAVEPLDGVPVLSLRKIQLKRSQVMVKRTFDLLMATLLLVLFSPILLIAAIAVKLTSEGPIFYKQIRVGQFGKEFGMIKFRTMVRDAHTMKVDLLDHNEADGLLFKIKDDPRVTKVGKYLRRWYIDELPQLLNVFAGRMSLVGPRPPLPEEVARYDDWLRGRIKVKPGMTGLWQVNGRHQLSFSDYVRYDLFYVENWSVVSDLHILWRTLPAVLSRTG
ncbi:MAG: sugar transferase [Actinomycetota bacterium]|nr:sugar transferase [Actinomycetota bacterium]